MLLVNSPSCSSGGGTASSFNFLIFTGAFSSGSGFLTCFDFPTFAGSGLGGSGLLGVLFGRFNTAGGGGEGDLAAFLFGFGGGDGLFNFLPRFGGIGDGLFTLLLGAGDGLFTCFFETFGGGGEGDLGFALVTDLRFGGGLGEGLGDFCLLPLLITILGGDGERAL